MCVEKFEVSTIESERDAYEVREYMRGLPYVREASCDILRDAVTIDYDESSVDRERIIDELEYAGCRVRERSSGVIDMARRSLGL